MESAASTEALEIGNGVMIGVAEHAIQIVTSVEWVKAWFCSQYEAGDTDRLPDLSVHISAGYGEVCRDQHVRVGNRDGRSEFVRADYRLSIDACYRQAWIEVYDAFALKHAMLNLYSAFIVHFEWGLMIHSSCAVENGKAYLFVGPSGAGKSTIARLSSSRLLLSDESTLLRFSPADGWTAVDSPFRSEIASDAHKSAYKAASILLLKQSERVHLCAATRAEAFVQLLQHVFYWAHHSQENAKVIRMVEKLARCVPTYTLHFQENDGFWELIS